MSRYDFRIRKQAFRSRNIDHHKDFGSLQRRYTSRQKAKSFVRLLVILIGLLLLICALMFTTAQSTPINQPEKVRVLPAEKEFSTLPAKL